MGAGFSTRNDNEVLLAGVPCKILASDARGITCEAGAAAASSPVATPGTLYPGGAGLLQYVWWKRDMTQSEENRNIISNHIYALKDRFNWFSDACNWFCDVGKIPEFEKPMPTLDPEIPPTFASINADSLTSRYFYHPWDETDNNAQLLEGFFVPPVSANFSWYVRGDDGVALWLSPNADPSKAVLVAVCASANGASSFWGSSFSSAQRSAKIWADADVPRYFKIVYVDTGYTNFWDVALRVHTEGGMNKDVMQKLTSPSQLESRSAFSIQEVSWTADDGTFVLEFDLGDEKPARQTDTLKYRCSGQDLRAVVSAAVPELVDIDTMEFARDGFPYNHNLPYNGGTHFPLTLGSGMRIMSDRRDGNTTRYTLQFFGAAAANLQVRVIVSGTTSDGSAFGLTLKGGTATGRTTIIEESGGDPFYWPAPMDFFRTALPLPAVEVRSNGLLAVCSHVQPLPNTIKSRVNYYTPGYEGLFPAPITIPDNANASAFHGCAVVYRADITPSLTGMASANIVPSLISTGDVLTLSGSKFATLADGVGEGEGSLDLTVDQLADITLIGTAFTGGNVTNVTAACIVTSASSSKLVCRVRAIPLGNYTAVRVIVALGRGLAAITFPTLTASSAFGSLAPSVGSRAGGTLITIRGGGFLVEGNNVSVGLAPCIVVDEGALIISCLTPALVDGTATPTAISDGTKTSQPVIINGIQFTTFEYDAALTPVAQTLVPEQLSSAVSGKLSFTLGNIPVSRLDKTNALNVSVLVDNRTCTALVVAVAPAADGAKVTTATVKCNLFRTETYSMPQPPLALFVSIADLGYAAVDSSDHPSGLALDPAFSVSSVSPTSGSLAGGTRLVISGVGFTGKLSSTAVSLGIASASFADAPSYFVPCAVDAVSADGTSIECVLSRPDYEGTKELADSRNSGIVGALIVNVNKFDAVCATKAGCAYTLSPTRTPTFTAIDTSALAADGSGNIVLTGTLLDATEGLKVWLGSWPASVVSSTATSVTVTVPPQTAGKISVWAHLDSYGNVDGAWALSVVYPLKASMTAATGSTAGGHKIVISGVGVSDNLARNIVKFGNSKATVVSYDKSEQKLTVLTPRSSSSGSSDGTVVSVAVLDAMYNTTLATVVLDAKYTYSLTASPTLTAAPDTVSSTEVLTLTGTALGTTQGTVSIGGVACTVTSWTDTIIKCTMGNSPAGTHFIAVFTPTGLADGWLRITVPLVATAASTTVGTGGGALMTLTGSGFSTSAGGANLVTVCGFPATVVASTSTYTSLSFLTPALPTKAASDKFNTYADAALHGTADSTESANAFDGSTTSRFRACRATLDLGQNTRGIVSRLRFFPVMSMLSSFAESVFSASEKFADGPWTTLYTVTGASVIDGWNIGDIGGSGKMGSRTAYRYLRWESVAGDCTGQEIEFVGRTFVANEATACPVAVVVKTPVAPLVPAATSTLLMLDATVTASTTLTPSVTSIVPDIGSALGGETIELHGTGFSKGVTSVVLNGMVCEIVAGSTTDTLIKCVTGVRKSIQPVSVRVTVKDDGLALVNDTSLVYFSYLDKWSALTTWLDDEPPGAGDTVIVPVGQAILVDISPPELFLVLVQGELRFDSSALQLDFTAHYIVVLGGSFEIGSEARPYMNKLTVTLKGHRKTAVELPGFGAKTLGVMPAMPEMTMFMDPIVAAASAEPKGVESAGRLDDMSKIMGADFGLALGLYDPYVLAAPGPPPIAPLDRLLLMSATPSAGKAIPAEYQGYVEIHGAPRKRTWTFGNSTSLAGSSVITLSEDVDWQMGEDLVISTTSFIAGESEHVRIAAVNGPRSITLEAPLAYTHECFWYSGASTMGFPDTRICFEVGLLSRNVVIQGDEASVDEQFGMHSIAAMGSVFRVENVEMRNCGQSLIVGRYCVHIHLAGEAGTSYARSNSFHDSFQRAVTLHASNNVHVEHNVAFHVMAHTFFVEDGVELNNVFDGNLVVSQLTSPGPIRSDSAASCFWSASPANIWRNNVCAGAAANGIWIQPPGAPTGPSATDRIIPSKLPLGGMSNNTIHGSTTGIFMWLIGSPILCNAVADQFIFNNIIWRNNQGMFIGETSPRVFFQGNRLIENYGGMLWHHLCENRRGDRPLVSNALFVSTMDPLLLNPPPKTGGIFFPLNDNMYGANLSFVNFGARISPVNACQSAGCFCSIPNVAHQPTIGVPASDLFPHGYTIRLSGMRFLNTDIRVSWDRTDAYHDLDGSFTGVVGGWVSPFHSYNDWTTGAKPQCVRDTKGKYGYGLICDSSSTLRTIVLKSSPNSLALNSLIVSGGSSFGFWADDSRTETVPAKQGQLVMLVSGHYYGIRISGAQDWSSIKMTYSEAGHLLASPLPEWVGVTLSWVEKRYSIAGFYPSVSCNAADQPCNGQIELANVDAPAAGGIGNPPMFGTAVMGANNSWSVALSKSLPGGVVPTLSTTFNLDVGYHLCPPLGCNPAPPSGSLGSPVLWSSLTWPAAGEDVVIGPTQYIMLDTSPPPIGRLTIYGRLEFYESAKLQLPGAGITLTTSGILIYGALVAGTASAPLLNRAEIVLTGVASSDSFVIDDKTLLGNKGIIVFGNCSLYGVPRARTWVRLASSAAKGDTTLSLSKSVGSSSNGAAWGVGDIIVLTETEYSSGVEAETTVEKATIASVSSDGQTITLTAPLAFLHYAGPVTSDSSSPLAGKRLAAAVGLLSRNLVVRGDYPFVGTAAPYGGRVFVSAVSLGAGKVQREYRGSLLADHTEFRDMGQEGQSWNAIDVSLNGVRAMFPSSLSSISIHRSFSGGVYVSGVPDFSITNSVLFKTHQNGIFFDPSSPRAVISANLIVGNYLSPATYCCGRLQLDRVTGQGSMMLGRLPAALTDNYVSGAFDAGIVSPGMDCASKAPYAIRNNEIAGVQVGFFILPYSTDSKCILLDTTTVWKASHIGIHSNALTDSNLEVTNALVADSFIGVFFRSALEAPNSGSQTYTLVSDSFIVGTSLASSSCAVSQSCRSTSTNDKVAKGCNSIFSTQADVRRIGYAVPLAQNDAKIYYDSDYQTYVADKGWEMCHLGRDDIHGRAGGPFVSARLNGVTFSGFSGDECGGRSAAIAVHTREVGISVPLTASVITWDKSVQEEGKFFLKDNNRPLLIGTDASFLGTPGSLLGSGGKAFAFPNCEKRPKWGNTFMCADRTYRNVVITSVDILTGVFRNDMPKTTVTIDPDGLNLIAVWERDSDTGCSMPPGNLVFPSINFVTVPSATFRVDLKSTEPAQTRFLYNAADPNEKVLLQFVVTRPNSQNIFLNEKLVPSLNDASPNIPSSKLPFPTISDPVGTSLFRSDLKMLTVVVGGGYVSIDIVRAPSVIVSMKVTVPAGQQLSDALSPIITSIATLLGIKESRIKVVNVHAAGTRRLADGSSGLDIEIIDEKPTIPVSATVAGNTATAASTSNNMDAFVQQSRMADLGAKVAALASSGEMAKTVAATTKFTVSVDTVNVPTVAAAMPSASDLKALNVSLPEGLTFVLVTVNLGSVDLSPTSTDAAAKRGSLIAAMAATLKTQTSKVSLARIVDLATNSTLALRRRLAASSYAIDFSAVFSTAADAAKASAIVSSNPASFSTSLLTALVAADSANFGAATVLGLALAGSPIGTTANPGGMGSGASSSGSTGTIAAVVAIFIIGVATVVLGLMYRAKMIQAARIAKLTKTAPEPATDAPPPVVVEAPVIEAPKIAARQLGSFAAMVSRAKLRAAGLTSRAAPEPEPEPSSPAPVPEAPKPRFFGYAAKVAPTPQGPKGRWR